MSSLPLSHIPPSFFSGETNENKDGIIQGHKDTDLSEKGVRQAQLAGIRLQTETFSHVFCSDLKRAAKTCEIIMQENVNRDKCTIVTDKRLRERKYGVFEGCRRSDFKSSLKVSRQDPMSFAPPNGESPNQIKSRSITFFQDLCKLLQQQQHQQQMQAEAEPEEVTGVKRRRQSSSFSTEVFPTDGGSKFFAPQGDLRLNEADNANSEEGHLNSGSTSSTTSGCSSITTDATCAQQPSCPDTPTSDMSRTSSTVSSPGNSEEDENDNVTGAGGGGGADALLFPSVDRDIQLAITPPQNVQRGWAPNVSLSPVFQHRLSSLSSISSGRSGSFEDEPPCGATSCSVLVVTHGGFIQQIIRFFVEDLHCSVPAGGKRYALQTTPNTGINKFSVSVLAERTTVDCLSMHDKDHLLLQEDVGALNHAGET